MKTNTMKAAATANSIELKNEKSAKAKRILVGADVHLRGYQAARKVDNGVIGVVENFRSVEGLLLYVEKQCERAEQVVVVYEAGPLGYTLYRMLKARGLLCYVCAPDSSEQKRKRRKNNKIDARSLTSKLFKVGQEARYCRQSGRTVFLRLTRSSEIAFLRLILAAL
jgi:transposase